MRSLKVWSALSAASLIVLGLSSGLAGQVQAQSFSQKVFGFGGDGNAPTQSVAPPPRTQIIPPIRLLQRDIERVSRQRLPDAVPDDEDTGPPDSGGPYRTMCVRTCDGFYFPLRAHAKHRNFASDVKSCKAACGSEARLFYYPERSGDTNSMIDLKGQSYADLPHAFAYRKALKQGCACKPVPWSDEAKAEHQKYAENEARELEKDKAFAAEQARLAAANAAAANAVALQSRGRDPAQGDAVAVVEARPVPPPQPNVEGPRAARKRAKPLAVSAKYQATSWPLFSPGKSTYRYPGDPR